MSTRPADRPGSRHLTEHVLKQLVFPSRYEVLIQHVSDELARLVVAPPVTLSEQFESLSQSIQARGEGLFVPMAAASGTGKTTLANSLSTFFPRDFAPTMTYTGAADHDQLLAEVTAFTRGLPANDTRVIPVLVDHRESAPPTSSELAAIKRFMREATVGRRVALLWPETGQALAEKMADDYVSIAGEPPVKLPLQVSGPPVDTWVGIAINTLEIANDVDSLELLGVDPRSYNPREFPSIGEYLRRISDDFTQRRLALLRETRRPVHVVIVIASESPDAGVLAHLTNSSKFGLLDGNALLDATKDSEVGRWWRDHRGLLIQMIVQLDVRVFGLPPTATVPVLRRFGPDDVRKDLEDLGVTDRGPSSIASAIRRSDLGKYLNGTVTPTFETRGTPSGTSAPAFSALAERGFTSGADKKLNRAVLEGLKVFLAEEGLAAENFRAEEGLGFVPLIPDTAFDLGEDIVCVEYTWRKGEFLVPKYRAAIAAYVLEKIRNYARELGRV